MRISFWYFFIGLPSIILIYSGEQKEILSSHWILICYFYNSVWQIFGFSGSRPLQPVSLRRRIISARNERKKSSAPGDDNKTIFSYPSLQVNQLQGNNI